MVDVAHFREKMRAYVDAGGPPVVDPDDGAVKRVLAVVTGKKTVAELKQDRAKIDKAKHQRAEAQAANYEPDGDDEGRRSDFVGGHPGGAPGA